MKAKKTQTMVSWRTEVVIPQEASIPLTPKKHLEAEILDKMKVAKSPIIDCFLP